MSFGDHSHAHSKSNAHGALASFAVGGSVLLAALLLTAFLLTALTARTPVFAEEPGGSPGGKPTESQRNFFEKEVRPLLVAKCYECHSGEDGAEPDGGLLLDSRAGWMQGGDSGAAITPGNPDASLLIKAINYQDSELSMPPDGKLSDQEIGVLTRWIKMGAPDPRDGAVKASSSGIDIEESRRFWSFHASPKPDLPEVRNTAWPRTGVDFFILANLEKHGLAPAPPADRRTLLRRASYDLIGLPPTPEEMAAFLNDARPDAYARQIDRLLASPRYGEKWGRHWLDVARYADSNGLDENVAHGNAWRYRDYVVRSFNADHPYDAFVVEQLAGDLLPPSKQAENRYDRLIATGFLVLGPKVLAEVDEEKMRMDIVDEQIDSTGRAFMGLTLGCCRCHDHKFDPFSAHDYYALAGIFKSTTAMESYKKIARWYEHEIPTQDDLRRRAEHEAQQASLKEQVDAEFASAKTAFLAKGVDESGVPEDEQLEKKFSNETRAKLKTLRDELAKLAKQPVEVSTTMGVIDGEVADAKIHLRGSHLKLGELAHRGFPRVLQVADIRLPAKQSGRLELARWMTSAEHPLTHRVMVNRMWRWHFGVGLVDTPDNFGRLGGRPSHPDLINWLAQNFIESGTSIKQMHRTLMLSSTYQMSSTHSEQAAKEDPENRLWWRMNVRRLEAEELRDALLQVAENLDLKMGGNLLPIKNRAFVFNHTSKDETNYDLPRRTLYLPVIRNNVYMPLALFDFPDPAVSSGNRATTTIAPQALFLLNSKLAERMARRQAEHLLAVKNLTSAERIDRLYETALSRPPSAMERSRAERFVQRYVEGPAKDEAAAGETVRDERELLAWQALCQVLLASNEFIYLR